VAGRLTGQPAAAHAEIEPTLGELIDRRRVLGQPERVAQRQHLYGGADLHPPRGHRERRGDRERCRQHRAILLEVQERFSHKGRYFEFNDVCVMPKPHQRPHPPIRVAASTEETYAMVGRMGLPIFVAPRTTAISELKRFLRGYHAGLAEAGHAAAADISISMPVYVAETDRQARDEAETSTMHFYRIIARALGASDAKAWTNEAREGRAQRWAALTYDDVLREHAIFGSPETVTERLLALREDIGFASLSAWMNPGGWIPDAGVTRSMRLFAERVAPKLG
jgi:alkanesulfonate monooxygenase SsuD/methylene tetrahydromethanopterin reductase-like flavin-dependent oxidoreductase (luciferase family)